MIPDQTIANLQEENRRLKAELAIAQQALDGLREKVDRLREYIRQDLVR